MSVAFSPDGSKLAFPWSLWDVATGTHTPLETFYSVAFSPDGTMLALGAYEARIILWDLAAGTRCRFETLPEASIRSYLANCLRR